MSYTLGRKIVAVWFEEIENPALPMADVALGNLGALPAGDFVGGAVPSAGWQATLGENLQNFKDRILADLKASGTTGVVVSLYWRTGFWQRNITCNVANLLPV